MPSAPWQVLVPVQDLVARPPEDAVWGWVAGVPPEGWFSLAGSLSIGCCWGGSRELGWAEVVWVLSRT